MNQFKEKMNTSLGVQLIIAGLAALVEDEGYSPHEAFTLIEEIKRNTFSALMQLKEE